MTSKFVAPALMLLLAACSDPAAEPSTPAAPAAAPPPAAGATAAPPATPAAASTTPSTQQDDTGMHIECQGTRLTVAGLPDQGNDAPPQTRLDIEKDGQRRTLDKPAEMTDYTAVGLACVQDKDNTPYFVVQYGELPFGCQFCEWFYLYDADGKQLTHSNPPLHGQAPSQEPNNDEYEQWLAKLGVTHPEVTYFKP
ncbi:hypothetical protein EDF77_2703 [Stenotrophomonas maltophilia]|nr:hypothetical protein EDF77_2703 [Stenotrophomonas maltophilia]